MSSCGEMDLASRMKLALNSRLRTFLEELSVLLAKQRNNESFQTRSISKTNRFVECKLSFNINSNISPFGSADSG